MGLGVGTGMILTAEVKWFIVTVMGLMIEK